MSRKLRRFMFALGVLSAVATVGMWTAAIWIQGNDVFAENLTATGFVTFILALVFFFAWVWE